jgi:hypothetical protein
VATLEIMVIVLGLVSAFCEIFGGRAQFMLTADDLDAVEWYGAGFDRKARTRGGLSRPIRTLKGPTARLSKETLYVCKETRRARSARGDKFHALRRRCRVDRVQRVGRALDL